LPAEYRQVVEGRGADRRSGSRATGSVDWRLTPADGEEGGEVTRVDVVISYALAGALAQIGRSGLVRDVVRRIGETFAQNLDARLADPAAQLAPAQLGGFTLLWSILADRVKALLARLTGSQDR
jgi:carbon-monoxide dehydrogenase small subunit